MIELIDVSYSYEGINALNHINLKIEEGESVCLLGPNGSGKSTLLKLINGIISPDSGVYKYNGEQVSRKTFQDAEYSKLFHQKIGYVFQNPDTQLFCSNVYDEIAFGPRQMGMDESEVGKRVNDCLNLLKLRDLHDRQPYHLSGGEKRKVAIACVLALNPEVLVLDEPMNGLDPRTERWLVSFLTQLNTANKTLITSTHNLQLAQQLSNRAILFDESHSVAADLQTNRLMEDIDLLKRVNLVDEYYHKHDDGGHTHFHIHHF